MDPKTGGQVSIANEVLADIAGYTALECYGVVGMTNPSVRDDVAQVLSRDKLRKGVRILTGKDGVIVHLHVIIEHGTKLAEVSRNLADRVRYVLTSVGDVSVESVEVHVQGIKVRK